MDLLTNVPQAAALFNGSVNYMDFFLRFFFDLVVIYIIAKQIYFRICKNRDYLFIMFIFNIIVFFVCYLLSNAKLSLGFAFGIFAIFSILRYRTMMVPIKEMTYMFIAISIAVMNALSFTGVDIGLIVFSNLALVFFIFLLEKAWVKNEIMKTVLYEKIEFIKPEFRQELIQDLSNRTGLKIHKVEINKIDFLRDVARINVYYYDEE